jgi:cell division protein FtsW
MKKLSLSDSVKAKNNNLINLKNQKRGRFDIILFASVIVLLIFGLIMVYDSSQFEAFTQFGDKYYYIRTQLISAVIGFFLLCFFTIFDYRRLEKIAVYFFIFSCILLVLVFVPGFGVLSGGAHRWLRIAGFTLQPAEIIKLSGIIFFAYFLQHSKKLIPFALIVGAVTIVVGLFQKDLGTAVVFCLISFSMYFVSGAPFRNFVYIIISAGLGLAGFIAVSSYRLKRVMAFLDPFADPQGYSYHIAQILIAVGSGGLFGVGIGQSRQKYAYIPEVPTDSIFAVIAEEFGFLGCLLLLLLLGLIIWRCFRIAEHAPDNFGKLLATGLTVWIGAQTVVNLSAMVSLMPLTGVPLSFISYGGSALIASLIAIGILLNISRQS